MELRYRTWMKWLSLGCSFFVTMQLEHHQSQKKQSKPKKSTITEQLSMITCLLILVAFLVSENSWGSRLISEENAARILETMSFFVASTLFFYFVRASKNIHTFSNALNNNNCEEQRTTKKIWVVIFYSWFFVVRDCDWWQRQEIPGTFGWLDIIGSRHSFL